MGAPASHNLSNLFVEGGLNWKAPFAGRDSDVLGLALSHLGISPALQGHGGDVIAFTGGGVPYAGNETVLELTYQYQAAPWWTLQPDLQIVLNPGATIPEPGQARLPKDTCIAGLRATITF